MLISGCWEKQRGPFERDPSRDLNRVEVVESKSFRGACEEGRMGLFQASVLPGLLGAYYGGEYFTQPNIF